MRSGIATGIIVVGLILRSGVGSGTRRSTIRKQSRRNRWHQHQHQHQNQNQTLAGGA